MDLNLENSFDIAQSIKAIEVLKSRLLSEVACLYENMTMAQIDTEKREDILSEIVILSYLLSDKLGVSHDDLDERIISKLKQDNNESIKDLLRHFQSVSKRSAVL